MTDAEAKRKVAKKAWELLVKETTKNHINDGTMSTSMLSKVNAKQAKMQKERLTKSFPTQPRGRPAATLYQGLRGGIDL
jgi:hypothetical protein